MTAPVVVGGALGALGLATALGDLARELGARRGPVLLVAADLVVHDAALDDLAEDPRPGTRVLVSTAPGAGPDLRVRAGRVTAAATPTHQVGAADASFVGAVRVGADDREGAARLAHDLAQLAGRHRWVGEPLGYLLLGLVRTGVPVGVITVDPWPWSRRGRPGANETAARLAGMGPDEVHAARLARAGKADDGLVATFLSRPLSRPVTRLVLRVGGTPNQVTGLSVLVGLAAAAMFALGTAWSLVAGAVLLQLSLVLDCVDGDVARFQRSFSPVGAWLDASTDRLKEFACYGGLAWGASAGRTGWVLAAAMLSLQTARHAIDYTFTAVKELRESEVVLAPLDEPSDPARPEPPGAATRALEASRRSSALPGVVWAKKAVHFGIGERWLVLSVLAALGHPVGALAALLLLSALSLLYTSAGRVVRTLSWSPDPVAEREREIVARQADTAPLVPGAVAWIAGPPGGPDRFRWVRPALLRAVEYGGVLALVALLPGTGPGGAAYLLLLVVAWHHYDDLYRVLHRLRPAHPLSRLLGLGWPGRLLVVAALALVGGAVGRGGLWVLAAGLGILFLVAEPARVIREVRSRPDLTAEGAVDG